MTAICRSRARLWSTLPAPAYRWPDGSGFRKTRAAGGRATKHPVRLAREPGDAHGSGGPTSSCRAWPNGGPADRNELIQPSGSISDETRRHVLGKG